MFVDTASLAVSLWLGPHAESTKESFPQLGVEELRGFRMNWRRVGPGSKLLWERPETGSLEALSLFEQAARWSWNRLVIAFRDSVKNLPPLRSNRSVTLSDRPLLGGLTPRCSVGRRCLSLPLCFFHQAAIKSSLHPGNKSDIYELFPHAEVMERRIKWRRATDREALTQTRTGVAYDAVVTMPFLL